MVRTRHFVALDGMRGIAAFLVFAYHVVLYFSLNTTVFRSVWMADHLYLLVDCFYVLSGFVIAHSFDAKMAHGLPFLTFMKMRLLRLYPMIVIGVLLGSVTLFALLKLMPQIGLKPILLAIGSGLLLLPTTALLAYKPWVFPVNSPHWSLSFEMLLYMLYAATYRAITPRLLGGAICIAAVALVAVANRAGSLNIGYYASDYWLAYGRVFYPFLVGIALRRALPFRPDASSRLGYLAVPLLALVALNPLPSGWIYDVTVVLLVLPLLVWLGASARPAAWLDRLSALGGEISYPLYAIHFPVVVALSNAGKLLKLGPAANLALATLCLVTVPVLAWGLLRFVDLPLRAALGRSLVPNPRRPSSSAGEPRVASPVPTAMPH